jgi:hypothetical protein
MKFKLLVMGLMVCGAGTVGTMLAQTTATAPATRPAAASAPSSQATTKPATASASTSASANRTCLRCHPWAKVVEASAKYATPDGAKGNPHVYLDLSGESTKPHDSKKDADIPECLKCHTAHAVSPAPKKGDIDLTKVSVKWCFDACHHEKNFEKCDKCH